MTDDLEAQRNREMFARMQSGLNEDTGVICPECHRLTPPPLMWNAERCLACWSENHDG